VTVRSRAPKISAAVLAGLPEAIERAGGSGDEILARLGLPRQALADSRGYMPAARFAQVLEEAARLTADDCFGLHFGERYHPKNIGPLAYVVLNSPTMAAAFANIARYLRVHNEAAEVTFDRDERWAYLTQTMALPAEACRQQVEFSGAVAVGLIRLMIGTDWSPAEVRFTHARPVRADEHARVFRAPVRFECEHTALVVDAEICERQVPAADARLYTIMLRYVEQMLDTLPREPALVARARECIGDLMRDGEPRLAQFAKALGLRPPTVQRRLKTGGVGFRALVDDTRRRLAARYLADPNNTVTDVAFLLGYSEVSAFNRAFKRWTGRTPTAHRRRDDAPILPPSSSGPARTTKVRSRLPGTGDISTPRRTA
jgi:AraC-like DNA-binding protein